MPGTLNEVLSRGEKTAKDARPSHIGPSRTAFDYNRELFLAIKEAVESKGKVIVDICDCNSALGPALRVTIATVQDQ